MVDLPQIIKKTKQRSGSFYNIMLHLVVMEIQGIRSSCYFKGQVAAGRSPDGGRTNFKG